MLSTPKFWKSCAFACLAVSIATLARLGLDPLVSLKGPFLFYAIGIVLAAFYGGSLAGILATILSLPVCDYLFIGPRYTWFRYDTPGDSIMLALLTALGIVASLMIGKWKGTRDSLQHTIAALEKSELKLRTLTATVPGILFTTTPTGECDYASGKFSDYSGLSGEPVAAAWKSAIHPEDSEKVLSAWSDAIRRSVTFDVTYRIRRSDGEYRWFRCKGDPVRGAQGEIVKWAGIATDVHDRMLLEQALTQRSEELQQSSAAFQGFAYRVSHDLREPLRMIGLYTEMMANQVQASGEQPLFIRFILEGVDRIQRQLSQLLDYARSGSSRPNRVVVDLNETMQMVLTNLHPAITETGASVECGDMPAILADPDQIRSVFQNLIGNALKYRGPEPPRVDVLVRKAGDCWEFSIHDNGIGFEMKDAQRIFGTFQRLGGTSGLPGSGLGLAIVKRIIEATGGRIWAESEPGKGSTFHFTVPAALPPATKVPQSPASPSPDSYSEPPVPPRL